MIDGSGTIRVLKRDGSVEEFDHHKLAAAIWRAMIPNGGEFRDAVDLAAAIAGYLHRGQWACVSSAGVFEMTVRVLRRVAYDAAADGMEEFCRRRNGRRKRLRIEHDGGQITYWDKGWLARLGGQSWKLSAPAARVIAGQVERELLDGCQHVVSRAHISDLFNNLVAQYGLADAVPVNDAAQW